VEHPLLPLIKDEELQPELKEYSSPTLVVFDFEDFVELFYGLKPALLLLVFLFAGCSSLPPREDVYAIQSAMEHKAKARELQTELRQRDLQEWADKLIETAMNEINQATAYEIAVLPDNPPKEAIQEVMDTDAKLRMAAIRNIMARLEASRNLRIYKEVEELDRWIDEYLKRRLQIDLNLYDSWDKLQSIADKVGVGEYLRKDGE